MDKAQSINNVSRKVEKSDTQRKDIIVANIIQDTRETKPWTFDIKLPSRLKIDVRVQGLKAGDYSLEGYDNPDIGVSIILERKANLGEFVKNLCKNWVTFKKELYLLSLFDVAQIVVEDDLHNIYARYKSSPWINQHPSFIIKRIAEIEAEYGVSTVFMSNRSMSQSYALNLFKYFLVTCGV